MSGKKRHSSQATQHRDGKALIALGVGILGIAGALIVSGIASGGSAQTVGAAAVRGAGYADVYDLGGIIAWQAQGYPIKC